MVLHILAYSGKLDLDWDTNFLKHVFPPEPRKFQDLRRLEGAAE